MPGEPDQGAWYIERIPVRRIAEQYGIASAILFLASDKASCIHGTTLFVDGGKICARG
jgi:glucose 1-dehydrogenase